MQGYLNGYLQTISQLTVDHASKMYDLKYPMLQSLPFLQVMAYIVLTIAAFSFVGLFSSSIMTPIRELAADSRNISQGHLTETDVTVNNKD